MNAENIFTPIVPFLRRFARFQVYLCVSYMRPPVWLISTSCSLFSWRFTNNLGLQVILQLGRNLARGTLSRGYNVIKSRLLFGCFYSSTLVRWKWPNSGPEYIWIGRRCFFSTGCVIRPIIRYHFCFIVVRNNSRCDNGTPYASRQRHPLICTSFQLSGDISLDGFLCIGKYILITSPIAFQLCLSSTYHSSLILSIF